MGFRGRGSLQATEAGRAQRDDHLNRRFELDRGATRARRIGHRVIAEVTAKTVLDLDQSHSPDTAADEAWYASLMQSRYAQMVSSRSGSNMRPETKKWSLC